MTKKYCKDCQYLFINRFEKPYCNRFNMELTEIELKKETYCIEFLLWFNK